MNKWNILINASQAIPVGSPDKHEIRVRVRAVDDHVEVSVDDTGIGIPPEDLSRIFEPFVTTKLREGTGLGLAICRQIVSSLGGRIDVESRGGAGTTFRVALPIAIESAAPA